MNACPACLCRSALIGHLAPHVAGRLGERQPARRAVALLSLPEAELIAAVAGSGPASRSARRLMAGLDASAVRECVAASGQHAVCRHDDAYPGGLAELHDPPTALFSTAPAGRLAELAAGPAISIVGARRASPTGLAAAYELGRGLAAAGITIISGLALGIDAAAHRGALDAAGPAIAVVAGGADVVYPRLHRRLWERIAREGAIVSELPPGTSPYRWSFPARNRIMAALSGLTVVVEARERSGSLITASFAAEAGRDVGAVPGSVAASVSAGSNRLLREGAAVIRGPQDALDELLGNGHGLDPAELARAAADRALTGALPPPLRAVLEAVEQGLQGDEIATAAGLAPAAARSALGRLEAAGLVRLDGLRGYVRRTG